MIGMPFEAHHNLRSMLQDESEDDDLHRCEVGRRLYRIRSADSGGQRSSASILINRMYATRGYASRPLPDASSPTRITLVASDHESTVATITVGFDSSDGLQVDTLFSQEVDALRQAGRLVCEFTTLAMDHVVSSRRVLASLFNVAYIYAHRVMGFDTLLIEVNPRHVRYYERMLGFRVMAPQRHSLRVGAPAVLLGVNFSYIREQGERFSGLSGTSSERSLYPDWFSPLEEEAIFRRLTRSKVPAANSVLHPFEPLHLLQA
jgi:hypothetical protein